MTFPRAAVLNDSGEEGQSLIAEGVALHYSRGQSTSWHAHYAWKLHIGLDAPVWLETLDRRRDFGPVAVVPPGCVHRTGAIGWSIAAFIEPGSRGTPWKASGEPRIVSGPGSVRLQCTVGEVLSTESSNAGFTRRALDRLAEEVSSFGFAAQLHHVDQRVARTLARLKTDDALALPNLARRVGLSVDRLSRLTVQQTGLRLRQHVLWNRLLRLLSSGDNHSSLAAAAAHAGFSDHAHMTRTYRRFLGRAPSEFTRPPTIFAAW